MIDYKYRVWLIKYLLGVSFPPIALFYVLSKTVATGAAWNLEGVLICLACLASMPVYILVKGQLREWRDSVNAKKLNAQVIPSIKGKRYGNLDLIVRYLLPATFHRTHRRLTQICLILG